MTLEIERKFLVKDETWRTGRSVLYRQGYLNLSEHRTVRVRVCGEQAYLTIKGPTDGATRVEYEYEIPVDEGHQLLLLSEGTILEKHRTVVEFEGLNWEIDEFLGDNEGLIVAEVELASEDQQFERPSWAGKEVTHDKRYYNSRLVSRPYLSWSDKCER